MKSTYARHGASSALVVGAALTLLLAGCSSSSDSSASDDSTAASSAPAPASTSASAAAPDVEATTLLLPESDFPTGGKYKVSDRAAIDNESSSDKPTITPEPCAKLGNASDDGDFDKAKAAWENDALQIDDEVKLGITESFDTVRTQVTSCPAMTLTSTLPEGGSVTAQLTNKIVDVTGANQPALAVVSEGTANVSGQEVAMQLTQIGSYVKGSTVSISITKIGGQMSEQEGALAVELLNKQIAAVVNAP